MPSQPRAWESWKVLWTQFQTGLLLKSLLYFCLRGEQLLKALLGSLFVFQWQHGQPPRAARSAGRAWSLLQPCRAAKAVAPE